MATFFNRRGRPPHPDILTPSEWRVLELVRQGKTNAEIAYELAISVPGVKYHITNMLGKLQVEDRAGLANWQSGAESRQRKNLAAAIPFVSALKAPAVAVGGFAMAGLAVAGLLTFAAAGRDDTPGRSSASTDQQIALAGAEFEASEPGYTRLSLKLRWDGPDPAHRPADISDHLTVTTNDGVVVFDGIKGREDSIRVGDDYPEWEVIVSFGDVPETSDTLHVELNGLPLGVISNGPSPRPVNIVDGHWTLDIPMWRDPTFRDITDRVPPYIQGGDGWGWEIQRVTATDSEVAITHRGRTQQGVNLGLDWGRQGALQFAPQETVQRFPIEPGASALDVLPGTITRLIESESSVELPISDSTALRPMVIAGTTYEVKAIVTEAGAVSVFVDGFAWPGLITTASDAPTLADNLGNRFTWTGASPVRGTFRYRGIIDPTATSLIFTMEHYPVLDQPDWVLTIPLD